MVNILMIVLTGALIGWIASMIMNTDDSQGAFSNIIIGIVGSLLSVWLFGDLLNLGSSLSAGTFSFMGIFWGIVGALILIAILKQMNFYSHTKA